jgi:hypothetical protein
MGLDATRGPDFDGVRARIAPEAMARAAAVIARIGGQSQRSSVVSAR